MIAADLLRRAGRHLLERRPRPTWSRVTVIDEFDPADPAYGWHLITDYRRCHPAGIDNPETLSLWVTGLVDVLGMKPHGGPIVESFAHHDPVTAGYSVVQLITTSSITATLTPITAHMSPHLRTAHVDVFSCRRFDPMVAMEYTASVFRASLPHSRSVFLGRG